MPFSGKNTSLKSLRSRYHLAITNEDTFEEVTAFNMTRWSVYLFTSFFFVLLVGLTILLIAFTPLKLYIPGYGQSGSAQEYETLKLKVDSLENEMKLQQQYSNGIKAALKGMQMPLDSANDVDISDFKPQK